MSQQDTEAARSLDPREQYRLEREKLAAQIREEKRKRIAEERKRQEQQAIEHAERLARLAQDKYERIERNRPAYEEKFRQRDARIARALEKRASADGSISARGFAVLREMWQRRTPDGWVDTELRSPLANGIASSRDYPFEVRYDLGLLSGAAHNLREHGGLPPVWMLIVGRMLRQLGMAPRPADFQVVIRTADHLNQVWELTDGEYLALEVYLHPSDVRDCRLKRKEWSDDVEHMPVQEG